MDRRNFTRAAGLAGVLAGAGFAGQGSFKRPKSTSAPTAAPTPAPTVAPTPAPTSAPLGIAYPFGARYDAYKYGIRVSNHTNAELDSQVATHYDAWKAARIVAVPGIAGGLADKF